MEANRDNTLKMSTEQSLDGVGVIRVAGSGCLYVISKKKTSSPPQSSTTSPSHTPSSSRSESPLIDTTPSVYSAGEIFNSSSKTFRC